MKVRVHDTAELAWDRIGDVSDYDINEEQVNSQVRHHEHGTDTGLEFMEVYYVADTFIPPHWHDVSELIYVAEGELHFGAKVLRPGSSVFVDKEAVYSFRAGPQGLKMLLFRPKGGAEIHMRGDHAGN